MVCYTYFTSKLNSRFIHKNKKERRETKRKNEANLNRTRNWLTRKMKKRKIGITVNNTIRNYVTISFLYNEGVCITCKTAGHMVWNIPISYKPGNIPHYLPLWIQIFKVQNISYDAGEYNIVRAPLRHVSYPISPVVYRYFSSLKWKKIWIEIFFRIFLEVKRSVEGKI